MRWSYPASTLSPRLAHSAATAQPRRRMVCICAPLGLRPDNFFPEKSGKDYELTPYLELLKDYRDDFSVISGLSHAGMGSGFAHQASASFLTGVPGAGRIGFRNAISLDQFAAEHIGGQTRFPSLTLSGDGQGLSWTRTGAPFRRTTRRRGYSPDCSSKAGRRSASPMRRLEDGRSILDDVRDQAAGLRSNLGSDDRDKLDEYLTSVRELEQRMVKDESWAKKPKPKVDVEPPKDIPNAADLIGRTRLLFDLTHLALQTDSTRLVTIMLAGSTDRAADSGRDARPPRPVAPRQGPGQARAAQDRRGGNDEDRARPAGQAEAVARRTAPTCSTARRSSSAATSATRSSHSVKNLPVLLAGGGFKHGQHLPFDPQNPPPLCNLYVSMLQRLGIEVDHFGTSTGTLTGLEETG